MALEEITQARGPIDEYVSESLGMTKAELRKAFSAEQVDGAAMSIYQMETGGALIIGDETGIGKGRQAAAMIRYAIRNGKVPVFFTKDAKLFSDMAGDLADIFSQVTGPNASATDLSVRPLIFGDAKKARIVRPDGTVLVAPPGTEKQPSIFADARQNGLDSLGYNAIFSTYSQINEPNARQGFLEWLTQNEDVVIVLDEAHEAAGDGETSMQAAFMMGGTIKRGKGADKVEITKPGLLSQSGAMHPRGGVAYLSATFAKRSDNMPLYFRTDLRKSSASKGDVISAMKAGGVALQQFVTEALSASGQYTRRERDFTGVSYDMKRVEVADEAELVRQVDEVTNVLTEIVRFSKRIKDAVKDSTAMSENAMGMTDFASTVHNQIGQLLLAAKADAVVEEAVSAVKRGEKPVVALMNTMGSFLDQFVKDNGLKPGDGITLTWNSLLEFALSRTLRASEKLPNGGTEIYTVNPADYGLESAYRRVLEAARAIKVKFPVSPIDYIIQKSAAQGVTIGELTGRSAGILYSDFDKGTGTYRTFKTADKNRLVNDFNSGALGGMLLNASGSTGLSIHASEKFKDQKPRHMIIAQPALDINVFMQTLGRIKRTGMLMKGTDSNGRKYGARYTHMVMPLNAEIRPAVMAARKMKSLNANTTGESDSAVKIEAEDLMNKYGDRVVSEYLERNQGLASDLDLEVQVDEEGDVRVENGVARKFTGRMSLRPDAEQAEAYAEITRDYRNAVEQAKTTGEYDLEIIVHDDWDGTLTATEQLAAGSDESSVFTSSVNLQQWEITDNRPTPSGADMQAEFERELGSADAVHRGWSRFAREADTRLAEQLVSAQRRLAELQAEPDDEANERAKATAIAIVQRRISSLTQQSAKWEDTKQRMDAILENAGKPIKFADQKTGESDSGMLTQIKYPDISERLRLAPSAFKFTFLLNRPGGRVFPSLAQFRGEEGYTQAYIGETAEEIEGHRGGRREKRLILTGNPIKAYSSTGGKGKVVRFKSRDGAIITGLIMPRGWSAKQLAEDPRSELVDGEAVGRYLDALQWNPGYVESAGNIRISRDRWGTLAVTTPAAKRTGGDVFLDEELRQMVGDFWKSGSRMTANLSRDRVAAVAARVTQITGKRFRGTATNLVKRANGVAEDESAPAARPVRATSQQKESATEAWRSRIEGPQRGQRIYSRAIPAPAMRASITEQGQPLFSRDVVGDSTPPGGLSEAERESPVIQEIMRIIDEDADEFGHDPDAMSAAEYLAYPDAADAIWNAVSELNKAVIEFRRAKEEYENETDNLRAWDAGDKNATTIEDEDEANDLRDWLEDGDGSELSISQAHEDSRRAILEELKNRLSPHKWEAELSSKALGFAYSESSYLTVEDALGEKVLDDWRISRHGNSTGNKNSQQRGKVDELPQWVHSLALYYETPEYKAAAQSGLASPSGANTGAGASSPQSAINDASRMVSGDGNSTQSSSAVNEQSPAPSGGALRSRDIVGEQEAAEAAINAELDKMVEAWQRGETARPGDPAYSGSAQSIQSDVVDQMHIDRHTAESIAEWDEEAQRIRERMGDAAARAMLFQKMQRGEFLTPAETRLALTLEHDSTKNLRTPEQIEAHRRFRMAWRISGREVARSLSSRMDPYMTPAERAKAFIMDEIMEPSPTAKAQAAKKRQQANNTPNAAEKKELEKEANRIEDDSSKKRLAEVVAKLKEAGFTLQEFLNTRVVIAEKAPAFESMLRAMDDWKRTVMRKLQGGDIPFRTLAKQIGKTEKEVRGARDEFEKRFTAWAMGQLKPGMTADDLVALTEGVLKSQPAPEGSMSDADKQRIISEAMMKMGLVPPDKQGKAKVKSKRTGKGEPMDPDTVAALILERWKSPNRRVPTAVGQAIKDYLKAKAGTEEAKTAFREKLEGMGVSEANAAELTEAAHQKLVDSLAGRREKVMVYVDMEDAESAIVAAKALSAARGDALDILKEYWYASYLSGPKTQIVNLANYPTHLLLNMGLKRTVAAAMGSLFGARSAKTPMLGELGAMWRAMGPGILDGLRLAVKSWKTGVDFLAFDKLHDKLAPETAAEDYQKLVKDMGLEVPSPAIPGRLGGIIRWPMRAMQFMDVLGKTIVAHMEAAANAYRIAKTEQKGKTFASRAAKTADMEGRMTELLNTPGSPAWQAAITESLEAGFQTPLQGRNSPTPKNAVDSMERAVAGVLGAVDAALNRKSGSAWANAVKLLAKMILFPFVKTPYNIARVGARMSPLGIAPFIMRTFEAGLMKMRGKKEFLDTFGKFFEHATEQVMAWTAFILLAGMAEGDDDDDKKEWLLTGGPLPGRNDRAENMLRLAAVGGDYTFRVYGTDIPFSRYEPIATALGTTVDAMRAWKMSEADAGEKAHRLFSSLLGQMEQKTFMQGLSNAMSLMDDLRTTDKSRSKMFGLRVLSSFVPNIIRAPLRDTDDLMRESRTADASYMFWPSENSAEAKVLPATGKEVRKEGPDALRLLLPTGMDPGKAPEWVKGLAAYNANRGGQKFEEGGMWAPDIPGEKLEKHPLAKGRDVELSAQAYNFLIARRATLANRALTGEKGTSQKSVERIKDAFEEAGKTAREELRRRPLEWVEKK